MTASSMSQSPDADRRRLSVGVVSRATFWSTLILFVACIIFGGASQQNDVQELLLQLAAIPVLLLGIWRLTTKGRWGELRVPAILFAAVGGLLLLYLIPLPMGLWENIPGRGAVAEQLRSVGLDPSFAPLSLTPEATRACLFWLIPPAAIFFASASLTHFERQHLASAIVALVIVSMVVGVLQVTGGKDSAFFFYDYASNDAAVGLFSNRNHQATFILIGLVFAATWLPHLQFKDVNPSALAAVVGISLVAIAIVSLAIVKSRAGILLLGPVLAGCLLVAFGSKARRKLSVGLLVFLATVVVGSLLALNWAMSELLERLQAGAGDDLRLIILPKTLEAARHYLPFGSGPGSFIPVYQNHEDLLSLTGPYVNQAHNEYLQIFLETGWFGLAILLAGATWVLIAAGRAWFSPAASRRALEISRAASVVIALVAVHSIVDYPARTYAIAVVVAFSVACLATSRRAHG